jgi:hypothetical protein
MPSVYIETTIPSYYHETRQHLTVRNGRLGLPIPVITTPLTLMPED